MLVIFKFYKSYIHLITMVVLYGINKEFFDLYPNFSCWYVVL